MNKDNFIRAINKAKSISALVRLTDTKHYILVNKDRLLEDLAAFDDDCEFRAQALSGGENLFIG